MERPYALYLCLGFLCLRLMPQPAAAQRPHEVDFFEKRIRPVLVRHCYNCHSSRIQKPKGGLRVDSREALFRGGESGPAVVPKNLQASTLIQALRHSTFEMPPQGKLPTKVIRDFEKWVTRGAAMPPGFTSKATRRKIDLQAARSFWAFRRLQRHVPSRQQGDHWSLTAIDRFIWKRVQAQHKRLRPAADVDRRTYIRRLYFDVVGLPPTPAVVRAFLDDKQPGAEQRLVDRLLANPAFGERWGRHWLDVARYAESVGGGRTKIYQDAWRYRDYVYAAFNRDKPYDQFLKEQIAGDLLPYTTPAQRAEQLIATGFLLLGPINYELQDKQLLRMDIVDEQLDTIGRSMLGMTIGCARCHDHKFDPIPTTDYYALAGIFRSTHSVTPGNVSGFLKRTLPEPPDRQLVRTRFNKQKQTLTAKINRLQSQLGKKSRVIYRPALAGIVLDDRQAEVHGSWLNSTSVGNYLERGYVHDMGQEKGDKWLTYRPQLAQAGKYEIRISYTPAANRSPNALVVVATPQLTKRFRIDQRKPPNADGVFHTLGKFELPRGAASTVTISNEGTAAIVIADAVQFIPAGAAAKTKPRRQTARGKKRRQLVQRLQRLQRQLKKLSQRAPAAANVAMAVEDHQEAGDFYVCVRGDIHTLGQKVKRGFLSVISPDKPQIPAQHSGRLEFARWLGRADNPLVARVIANRVWQHLFGIGIVRTPDNFGTMGERPTHPLLLDYLAAELIRGQWSVKSLVKQIVLSRTYRMSSQHPRAKKLDPDNLLFARRPRVRLDAECIRDAILSVSGELSRQQGGPTVRPGTKSEFGYRFASRRRSAYVPSFRNQLDDLLQAFDVADPNIVMGRRAISTLPTQALFLLNSPFVHQQARAAADRLLQRQDLSESGRLQRAYELTLGRPPSSREQRICQEFLSGEAKLGNSKSRAWSSIFRSLYSCLDFRYMD